MKNLFLSIFLLTQAATFLCASSSIEGSTNNYNCSGGEWQIYLAIDMSMQESSPYMIITQREGTLRFENLELHEEGAETTLIKVRKSGMNGSREFTVSLPYIDETTTFFTAQLSVKTTSFVVGAIMENDPNMQPATMIELQCQAE